MCNAWLKLCISSESVIPFLGFHLKHIIRDLCKYLAPRIVTMAAERSVNPEAI